MFNSTLTGLYVSKVNGVNTLSGSGKDMLIVNVYTTLLNL